MLFKMAPMRCCLVKISLINFTQVSVIVMMALSSKLMSRQDITKVSLTETHIKQVYILILCQKCRVQRVTGPKLRISTRSYGSVLCVHPPSPLPGDWPWDRGLQDPLQRGSGIYLQGPSTRPEPGVGALGAMRRAVGRWRPAVGSFSAWSGPGGPTGPSGANPSGSAGRSPGPHPFHAALATGAQGEGAGGGASCVPGSDTAACLSGSTGSLAARSRRSATMEAQAQGEWSPVALRVGSWRAERRFHGTG